MPKLFIPQEWADSAHMEDKIVIDGLSMVVRRDQKTYRLKEAVRIMRVEGGDPDPLAILGKVKTHEQIEALGGELVGDSLICGETAYRVQGGFLAEFNGAGDPISDVFRT